MDFTSGDSPYGTPEAEDVLLIHVSENLASPSQRMTRIRMIMEDLRNRKGADDDVIGALQLTFNKEELKKVCPRRTVLVQSGLRQPSTRCYGPYS